LAFVGALVAALIWSVAGLKGLIASTAPALHANDYAAVYGALSGHALYVAAIIWLVVCVGLGAIRAPVWAAASLGALLALTIGLDAGLLNLAKAGAEGDDAQARIAAHEISAAVRAAAADPEHAVIDTRPKASGDLGELERITKTYIAAELKDRRDYRDKLRALGFPDFMQPSAIARDRHLARTTAALAQAEVLVAAYSKLDEQRMADVRAAYDHSTARANLKAPMLAGFDKAAAESSSDRAQLWALEGRILTHYQQAVGVLRRSEGRWRVSGEVYVFSRDSDLRAWQSHIGEARRLADEQQRIQQARQAQALAKADKLDREAAPAPAGQ
jgi:hypothetical protein